MFQPLWVVLGSTSPIFMCIECSILHSYYGTIHFCAHYIHLLLGGEGGAWPLLIICTFKYGHMSLETAVSG